MGRLEAGEAPGQGIQNEFVEAQQIEFGGSGRWEGWRAGEAPGQGIQNQFVEAQQIDFGSSGRWEGWRLGRHPGRESKINLLRLNKLILVVQGRGKAGGWGGTRAGNPK